MVIKAKIEKVEKNLEKERQAVIEKGAAVSGDTTNLVEIGRKSIVVRIPLELLEKIDKAVDRRYGMTRTAWLLQAAQEKLERENEMD
jgi:hypothetical protein